MGEGGYFYPPNETPTFEYQVSVKPAPADESVAKFHRHTETGPVIDTKELAKVGMGKLPVPLGRFTAKDSPIVIEFSFKKKGQKPHTQSHRLCLAEGVPAKIKAPATAKPGDKIKLEVTSWAALLHDLAGKPPRETAEAKPDRIPADTKKSVKWRIEWGKKKVDLDATGEHVEYTIDKEQVGYTLDVYAYVGDFSKRAKAQVGVPAPVFLALEWKDPEGETRSFPEHIVAHVVYDDGTEVFAGIVDAKGALKFEALGGKKWMTVKLFTKDICFAISEDGKEQKLIPAADVATYALKKYRSVGFPESWTVTESNWEVKGTKTWSTKTHRFELGGEIGTEEKPVRMTLDPNWQFLRFEFFDRFHGEKEHKNRRMPLPTMILEGFDEGGAAGKSADARAYWVVSPDDTSKTAQAIPWLRQRKADGKDHPKPDKDAAVQFRVQQGTFVVSESATSRKLEKITDKKRLEPSADRLKLYDLPPLWRSKGYWARPAKGAAAPFEKLDRKAIVSSFDSGKPIVISLDDIVICDDKLQPIALAAGDEVTIFHHGFSSEKPPKKVSAQGIYEPGDDAKTKKYFPYSNVTPREGSYLSEYPDWTRLVVVGGNLFCVFAERTPDGAHAVGARAAVRYADLVAEAPKVGDLVAKHSALHAKDYFAAEACFVHEYDDATSQDRAEGVYKEWVTPYAFRWRNGIGRSDYALLRCCGVDPDDPTNEVAVRINYFRFDIDFKADPADPVQTDPIPADKQSGYRKRVLENIPKRWNGTDGVSGAVIMEPQDAAKKLRVRSYWFAQHVPSDRAHYKLSANYRLDSDRAYMSGRGVGRFGKTDDAPRTDLTDWPHWFTAAHECGHGSALPDEYNEISSAASYWHLSFNDHLPGDPFALDSHSMMNHNEQPRPRHFWHAAEWVRKATGVPLQVVQKGLKLRLPAHAANAPYRTYAYAPLFAQTTAKSGAHGRFNLFLYHLGDTSVGVDWRARLFDGTDIDGLLIIVCKVKMTMPGMKSAEIQAFLDKFKSAVDIKLNKMWTVKGDVGAGAKPNEDKFHFERCGLWFSPRFLVEDLDDTDADYVTSSDLQKPSTPPPLPADWKKRAYADLVSNTATSWPRHQLLHVQKVKPTAWDDTFEVTYHKDPRNHDERFLGTLFASMVGLEGGIDAAHIKSAIVDKVFNAGAVVSVVT